MCGITGIYSFNNEGNFNAEVSSMNNALKHRGPDDRGVADFHGLSLGHQRLAIIDLSPAGHQPMQRENVTIVFNGEIYNFRDVRNKLKKFSFTSDSDTEVLIRAWQEWGTQMLDHLNGMFAFAIWDADKQQLFIARDRLGIKPLYYSIVDGRLIFASELRSVLASGKVKKKLNRDALYDYFSYQTVHAPKTIIENVNMLMPGHYIVAGSGDVKIEKWWSPRQSNASKTYSPAEARKNVFELLGDAVNVRMVADVPFGAFLSGGIDSSLVVGLMQKVSAQPVKTFSVVFDDSEYSEAKFARKVADHFHTEHHEIKLAPTDFLEMLPSALNAMDHPSGDGPNTYVVSGATRKAGVTMALSGLGGDELFAGYPVFKRLMKLRDSSLLKYSPGFARKMAGELIHSLRKDAASQKAAEILKLKSAGPASVYPLMRKVLLDAQIEKLFQIPGTSFNSHSFTEKIFRDYDDKHLISAISEAEIATYMQNVLLRDADQMSMAHALEIRVPFLDYRLVEFVLSLDDSLKFPVTPKKLLADSFHGFLPDEIFTRKKMGFVMPWEHWMKNELRELCHNSLLRFGQRSGINSGELMQLWRTFEKGQGEVSWSRIWPLVVLENWMEQNGIEW